jgi:hypothetical protein
MNNNVSKSGSLKFWVNGGRAIYQNVRQGEPIVEEGLNEHKEDFKTNLEGAYADPDTWIFQENGIKGIASTTDPVHHNKFMWFTGTYTDFAVFGKITFVSGKMAGFRVRDGADNKGVEVAINVEGGEVSLGGYGTEYEYKKLSAPIEMGKEYQIGAVFDGTNIKVYFNNRLLFESEQHALVSKSGRIGLWVHQAEVVFQDVMYYTLDDLPDNLGGGLPGETEDNKDFVKDAPPIDKKYKTGWIVGVSVTSALCAALAVVAVVLVLKSKKSKE